MTTEADVVAKIDQTLVSFTEAVDQAVLLLNTVNESNDYSDVDAIVSVVTSADDTGAMLGTFRQMMKISSTNQNFSQTGKDKCVSVMAEIDTLMSKLAGAMADLELNAGVILVPLGEEPEDFLTSLLFGSVSETETALD